MFGGIKRKKIITLKQKRQYKKLGKIWKNMGGRWGGSKENGGDFGDFNDPYHFEFAEKPA